MSPLVRQLLRHFDPTLDPTLTRAARRASVPPAVPREQLTPAPEPDPSRHEALDRWPGGRPPVAPLASPPSLAAGDDLRDALGLSRWMQTDLTPWFRNALGSDLLEAVQRSDPRHARLVGRARTRRGPFTAQIVIGRRGQRRAIGGGSHHTRPELAIARAVENSLEDRPSDVPTTNGRA